MGNNLSQSKAVVWSAIERFSTQGLQFILGIVIARLIEPSSYGLIAMLSIFIAIGQSLIDSGFASALIHKKNCSENDYSTVFIFNLIISIILYFLFYILSPIIADFYNQPELIVITRYTTLCFIINSLAIVQRTKLTKKLDFKSQSKASIVAVLLSGFLGIVMAYKGYGVWALVAQSIVSSIIGTLMLWYLSNWRPSFIFSLSSFKELYSFGSRLLMTGLISTIYNNLYTLIIGKYFSATDLGYYNKMQNISAFPSRNFTSIIARAVYPKQCKIQNNDTELVDNYLKLLSLSSFVIFPIMIGLSALSEPLVFVLLGEKWLNAYPFLSILCIAYMFDHVQYFNWQMLSVKGRSDLSLKSEIIKKIAAIIILVITIPMGINFLIWGLVLYSIIDIVIIIPFVNIIMPQINYYVEIKLLARPFLLSIIMFVVIKLVALFINNYLLQLIICGTLGFGTYLLLAKLMGMSEFSYYLFKFKKSIKR